MRRTIPSPSESDFSVGDVVLAYYWSFLYVVQVLEAHMGKSGGTGIGERGVRVKKYTIDFQVWRKSWSETISRDVLFQQNDTNLQMAHDLFNGARKRQLVFQPTFSVTIEGTEELNEKKQLPSSSPTTAMIQIPQAIQWQLVNDWEMITKDRKLVKPPKSPNVEMMLYKWIAGRMSVNTAMKEVTAALLTYFNMALPKMLLYSFKRRQYRDYFATDGEEGKGKGGAGGGGGGGGGWGGDAGA